MVKTVKKAKKAKPTKSRRTAVKAHTKHPEDHIDGCLCDVEVPDHMYTRDEDLPVAKGGVARR